MKFYYNGKKKSNEIGGFSGCLLLVGFGALIYFFTLLDGVEDLKEYWFQILLVSLMGISLVITLFGKKGELSNRHVLLENGYFKLDKVGVPISKIELDIYSKQSHFARYHLRDIEGKISIYSVVQDDLYSYFLEEYPGQINQIEEYSSKHDGPYISVNAEQRSLYYNLESGKYSLKISGEDERSFVPDIYSYDGKYKKAVPLKKTKNI